MNLLKKRFCILKVLVMFIVMFSFIGCGDTGVNSGGGIDNSLVGTWKIVGENYEEWRIFYENGTTEYVLINFGNIHSWSRSNWTTNNGEFCFIDGNSSNCYYYSVLDNYLYLGEKEFVKTNEEFPKISYGDGSIDESLVGTWKYEEIENGDFINYAEWISLNNDGTGMLLYIIENNVDSYSNFEWVANNDEFCFIKENSSSCYYYSILDDCFVLWDRKHKKTNENFPKM